MSVKEKMSGIKQKIADHKDTAIVTTSTVAVTALGSGGLTVFATDPEVSTFQVTSTLVQPVVTAINSGLDVLVPIGIGIMATFIGIRLIRRIIYTFL